MKVEYKIKNCPYCGRNDLDFGFDYEHGGNCDGMFKGAHLVCKNCNVVMSFQAPNKSTAVAGLVETWNSRHNKKPLE